MGRCRISSLWESGGLLQCWSFRLGRTTGALAVETIDASKAGISNVYDGGQVRDCSP
jgi:hypothetical protein